MRSQNLKLHTMGGKLEQNEDVVAHRTRSNSSVAAGSPMSLRPRGSGRPSVDSHVETSPRKARHVRGQKPSFSSQKTNRTSPGRGRRSLKRRRSTSDWQSSRGGQTRGFSAGSPGNHRQSTSGSAELGRGAAEERRHADRHRHRGISWATEIAAHQHKRRSKYRVMKPANGSVVEGTVELGFNGGCYAKATIRNRTFRGVLLENDEVQRKTEKGRTFWELLMAQGQYLPLWDPLSGAQRQRSDTSFKTALLFKNRSRAYSLRGDNKKKVTVVGGGISGLAAARELANLGAEPILLEARMRLGGRCHSISPSEFTVVGGCSGGPSGSAKDLTRLGSESAAAELEAKVDVGAMWIHGMDGNPLVQLSDEIGLSVITIPDRTVLHDFDGTVIAREEDIRMQARFNALLDSCRLHLSTESKPPMAQLTDPQSIAESDVAEGLKICSDMLGQHVKLSDDVGASRQPRSVVNKTPSLSPSPEKILPRNRSPAKSSNASLGHAFRKVLATDSGATAKQIRIINWHVSNLEYSNATNISDLSLEEWDQDDIFAFQGPHGLIKEGYSALVDKIGSAIADKRFGTAVRRINYEGKTVIITTDKGIVASEAVLVTVPLGLLKDGAIAFKPALPLGKQMAINRLGYGLMNKVFLEFESAFWDQAYTYIGYASNRQGEFYIFLDQQAVSERPVLMTLMSGSEAKAWEQKSDSEVLEGALRVLRVIFGTQISKLVKFHVTRWSRDQWSRGSYSYIRTGSSGEDIEQLAEPVSGKVFFAGEATNREHPASVHGALLSGLREARRIVSLAGEEIEPLRGLMNATLLNGQLKDGLPLRCCFCNLDEEEWLLEGPLLRFTEHGASQASGTSTIIAHANCAGLSSDISCSHNLWRGVRCAASSASYQRCAGCGERGASVKCLGQQCGNVYHIRCASNTRWDVDGEYEGKFYFCPAHRPTFEGRDFDGSK